VLKRVSRASACSSVLSVQWPVEVLFADQRTHAITQRSACTDCSSSHRTRRAIAQRSRSRMYPFRWGLFDACRHAPPHAHSHGGRHPTTLNELSQWLSAPVRPKIQRSCCMQNRQQSAENAPHSRFSFKRHTDEGSNCILRSRRSAGWTGEGRPQHNLARTSGIGKHQHPIFTNRAEAGEAVG
jgi:hypothetical protein